MMLFTGKLRHHELVGRSRRSDGGWTRCSTWSQATPRRPRPWDVIERFNAAFSRHDVDAVMALMTDDCVFENTFPPPDGQRYVGQAAVRAFWEQFFSGSSTALFDVEDLFAAGERCAVRWIYRWAPDGAQPGHVRGVDIFRVREARWRRSSRTSRGRW